MKATAILLYSNFSEYELSITLSVLEQGKKRIQFVGLNDEMVVGEAGLRCVPQLSLRDAYVDQFDSFVISGCNDFEHMVEQQELFNKISEFSGKGHLVAAISSAPYLLAKAGILHGKKYTVGLNEEQRSFLGVFNEEQYCHEGVVQAGNIVTARGRYYKQFAFQVADYLNLSYSKDWY
ncbi:DJ-1/PfpI family protein [Paenibacillus sp. 481]|uniref:DJ-1/PfpI family protein n=1 Tax=Paenibacillus sp. 481 TaxID=2835869 RepID=UPI001E62C9F9|nr:DJ-1/PfpI family protein [Paenibacillus sp. 481]UHA73714.1 DJ-1/PfpI family protein [Paenibacillus sp. 481]